MSVKFVLMFPYADDPADYVADDHGTNRDIVQALFFDTKNQAKDFQAAWNWTRNAYIMEVEVSVTIIREV